MRKLFLAAAMIAVASSAAYAHDFFLMPEAFTTPKAGGVNIQATVGSSFPKAENVVTADRVDRLLVQGPGKPQLSITGTGTNALNLRVTGAAAGTVAAGVSTKPRDVEYAEAQIPVILEEYRVSPTAQAAVAALAKPRALKVSSRRFAKTIVCVQRCGNRQAATRAFGAELEFVASNASGDHYRLLKGGRPLGSYPIDLVGADGKRQHLQTDAKGEVHLSEASKGRMMLFSAVMTPPAAAERFTLDLTSLTIERR